MIMVVVDFFGPQTHTKNQEISGRNKDITIQQITCAH
jgi:hypothetical protein